ncbi:MAG: hypothetical protein WCX65_16195 [bacterium]
MISKNIKIIDIDPDQYERAFEFFRNKPRAEKKTLIIFYQENRVIHSIHSKKGPVEITNFRGPQNLKPLAKEFEVDNVVCVERGAIHRFTAGAQSRIRMDRPLMEQLLAGREPFEREWGAGIHVYPDPIASIPRLPDFALKAARSLLPKKGLAIITVFDRDEVWISLILEMKDGEATLISTTDTLQPLSLEGLDTPHKINLLLETLARVHGRATVGVFMDRACFEHLAAHPKPLGALARLAHLKWVTIRPLPHRMRFLLAIAPLLKI